MNTFIEFLAKRDQDLLLEYAHEYKRILEQDEAPAQKTWYQKIGPAVMKAAAPLTAGLMLAGGINQKAHAAPQDPSQGQKAPTSQTMKPDAKNPMKNNMNPMQQSNYNSNFKAGLQQFVKSYFKVRKYDDGSGNGKIYEDIVLDDNLKFNDINYMVNHEFDSGSDLTGQDMIKMIQDIKDSIPTSFTKLNDARITFMTNKLITKAMMSANTKSITPQQAKTILQHWTNPIEVSGQIEKTNQDFQQLQKIAQGQ